MSTAPAPPIYGGTLPDPAAEILAHHQMQTTLLHAIHKRLEPTKVPFRVQVPALPTNAKSVPFMSAAAGEILTIQNPTAATLTIDLYENDDGNTVLRVQVLSLDFKGLNVPFFGRLFARGGTGMIVSGNVFG